MDLQVTKIYRMLVLIVSTIAPRYHSYRMQGQFPGTKTTTRIG